MSKYCLFEIRAAGLIFNKKEEILLVKNPLGTWGVPIGHMEKNESIQETLNREILEETRIKIKILSQLEAKMFGSSIVVPFVCKYKSGTIKLQKTEVLEYKWISIRNVKKLKLTFKGLIKDIKIGLKVLENSKE